MILLQANDIARRFADETLYENISFNIQTRDRIALVGRNGTGKSTLLKQIMGEEPLSSGTISKAKGLKIGYLEQHVAIDSNKTIWEEMLSTFSNTLALRDQAQLAAEQLAQLSDEPHTPAYQTALTQYDRLQEALTEKNAYAIESEIRTVLHGFQFYEEDYQTPVQSLSGGQKTRLALAQILLMDYDLLILDEPTNHLDMQTLAWLETYLVGYKGALLIVSHDRYFLDKVANQVIELRQNTLHLYKGNYSYYILEKEARLEQAWKEYQKQQVTIAKLEDFIQKNIVRASTTKRAQSRRKQLEKITRLEKPQQDQKAPRIQFITNKESGDQVLQADHLTIGYQKNVIAQQLDLQVKKQDAIAIVGPNGIGKSTFLKTIIGELPLLHGTVTIGTGVSIGYYSQNINQLDPNLSVLETLWRAHDTTDEWIIRSILGSFLFSGESVDKKVSMLSGGEKARLTLALLAANHDNTLILDEPTNHLDIDSKEVLEQALIEFDGTLIFVSHDRYFINRVATKILEITPTGAQLYLGDYDYYLTKKEELELLAKNKSENNIVENLSEVSAGKAQLSYEESKQQKRELRRLAQLVDSLYEKVTLLETKINEIHSAMAAASLENDQSKLMALNTSLAKLEADYEDSMNQWEVASMELDEFEKNM
ncbi:MULTISPECIES: ABC-F family ATP-binding cassette domain-containing protein [unclassified Facklamia]|uniref:ABC-F family ATP-binding cassette domain-containing protein n=1 Tax=Aerococcaceae TaxID=186827 RepID=UPI0013BB769D|nr:MULTISPECIES: ABC-F family ATP-binding cassette domain-containing protein [unclassified Facklamia]NEW63997.1 ATP-binding cassette domain-containing protein [Facklamia sp. 252]NEW67468.1 ATP-binding cassette domain-containing protein [Facklamia sp. 253]QQD65341.1 ABC-F family ATP-binding cassette domain-containing protein [Aerococcaceae bacterium zg-252]